MKKNKEKEQGTVRKQGFSAGRIFVVSSIFVFLFFRFFVDGMSYPGFNLFWNVYFFILVIVQLTADRLKSSYGREETLLLLFFLFSAISTGLAHIKGTGIISNAQILAYWCIFILIARNFTEKDRKVVFHIILFTGLLIVLYGLYQHFWGLEETKQYVYARPELLRSMSPTYINRLNSDRIFSTFVYPNVFASFLLFLIPISFFPLLSGDRLQLKVLCGAVFLLSLYNLYLTGSEGGFFIFLFVAQVMLSSLVMGNSKRFRTVLSCLIIFEVLLLLAGYHVGKLPKMSSFADRITYWKSSMGGFSENPVTGVGPENYRYHYPKFKPPGGMEAKHPHSIFFATLSETGMAGTIFLFGFLITVSTGLFGISGTSPFFRGLAFSFLAFLLHNLVDFNFINPSVAVLFFVSAGLGAENAKNSTPNPTPLPQSARKQKGTLPVSPVLTRWLNCLIMIAVLFTVTGYLRYVSSERNLSNAQREKNINNSLYYIEKAIRLYPDNFEVYIAKGDIFYNLFSVTREPSYRKTAEDSYRCALLLNPRSTSVYRKLAFLYEDSGRMKSAELMYLGMLETYPNKKQYNMEAALFYKKIGDEKNFRRYYEISEGLPGVSEEEGKLVEEYRKWIESQK